MSMTMMKMKMNVKMSARTSKIATARSAPTTAQDRPSPHIGTP